MPTISFTTTNKLDPLIKALQTLSKATEPNNLVNEVAAYINAGGEVILTEVIGTEIVLSPSPNLVNILSKGGVDLDKELIN